MSAALDVLRFVQSAFYLLVGVVAIGRWLADRGAARAWVAVTFGTLGLISGVGLLLPETPEPGTFAELVVKVLVASIGLFPYFLFRFAGTFRRRPRWLEVAAAAGTAAVGVGAFLVGSFPATGQRWSPRFAVYAIVLILQWVVLSGIVAVELWRAGHGQPTVSRRRMRVLSVGSASLAFTIVLSASSGGTEADPAVSLFVQLVGLVAAPLFLVGFAPPRFLLAAWRRPELEDLRAAEEVLMLAVSQAEVGDRLLPHVTGIIGGSGSALFAADGSVLGVHGLTPEEVAATATSTDPTLIDVPLRRGRLVVRATPYSPYFARSERELLSTVAALTDLALSRAEISDRERQTAAELAAANQAMLEFVAIASHDLRTPVTVIKGFAATLEDDWERIGPEQRRQYLATVHRHAEHLSLIVDDLLTTSRLDAGVVEPSLERVEVAPFLRRLLDDLRSEESAPVEVDADPGLALLADKDHFHRMVTNYLINAFRYGEPPLVVQGVSSNGCVEVRVCDAGPGLPPEFEGRAFEKFSRVDKRHSRDNQGTGLGLAIVRGLARASGGDAWYEPNRPKGSCFVLRFPAAD